MQTAITDRKKASVERKNDPRKTQEILQQFRAVTREVEPQEQIGGSLRIEKAKLYTKQTKSLIMTPHDLVSTSKIKSTQGDIMKKKVAAREQEYRRAGHVNVEKEPRMPIQPDSQLSVLLRKVTDNVKCITPYSSTLWKEKISC